MPDNSNQNQITLSTPVQYIKGVGPKLAEKFAKLKLKTVKDVLYYFPFRYQDFSNISKISELEEGKVSTIYGIVEKIRIYKTWKRKMWIVEATVADETGKVKAVWFNQKFIINVLKEGIGANFSGKITSDGKHLTLSSPEYEVISKGFEDAKHTGKLVAIYPETKGITSRGIRLIVSKILPFAKELPEFLPDYLLKKNNLSSLSESLINIHSPEKLEDAQEAEKRFSFQDLFLLQIMNVSEKNKLTKQNSYSFDYNPDYVKKLFSYLPFELTLSQKKTLFEVLEDLKKPHATNRLLQGDVGSGKTVVAAIASMVVASKNKQTVFMAPTEVLARQHYETFKKFFEEFGGGVALITSSQSSIFFGKSLETQLKKKDVLEYIKNGKVKIIIGTHSVIQKNVEFEDVGFVVIDEQHRFGVGQRAAISSTSVNGNTPHLLSMSATPIPRTLALTVFGDLELSIINEMPKNRKEIITKIVSPANRQKAYDFIKQQVQKGRQCFVICPRIEPAEEDENITTNLFNPYRKALIWETKAVKEEYEKLSKKIFPDLNVAMLHGKMKSTEKHEIMDGFKDKKYDILVSTSVIEVGIDIPNATIMMIEGSEHFGLSQLYQFRGRVGRGEHQSFCFLFTESNSKTTFSRMKALVNAKNGFELAEMDLKFRGPGQFLGEEQTGLPDLAMKAIQNPEMVKTTRDEAEKIIKEDPELKKYPYLASYLKSFEKQIHLE